MPKVICLIGRDIYQEKEVPFHVAQANCESLNPNATGHMILPSDVANFRRAGIDYSKLPGHPRNPLSAPAKSEETGDAESDQSKTAAESGSDGSGPRSGDAGAKPKRGRKPRKGSPASRPDDDG